MNMRMHAHMHMLMHVRVHMCMHMGRTASMLCGSEAMNESVSKISSV